MRRLAGIGLVLLAASGCAQFPDHIHLEVDGSSVDIKKAPPPGDSDTPAGNDQAPADGPHG